MMTTARRFTLSAATLIASAAAFAQPPAQDAAESPDRAAGDIAEVQRPALQNRAEVTFGTTHTFGAGFKDLDGEVGSTTAAANLGLIFPLDERSRLNVSLGAEETWYHFEDAAAFAPGFDEPWDNVSRLSISALYSRAIDETWSWFAGGSVTSAGEHGAEFEDTLTFGGFGGVNYKVNDKLEVGAGAVVLTRLEDTMLVLPVVTFTWRFADGWSAGTETGTDGLGIEVKHQWRENFAYRMRAGWDSNSFRLDDEGAAPEGVGRDQRLPIELAIDWDAAPQITVTARIGAILWGRYELVDAAGNDITEEDTDPTAYFGAAARFRF